MVNDYKEKMTAADLFAISQGSINSGDIFKCHWCSSKCGTDWLHDDVAPVPFVRSKSSAKCPDQPYICWGCWLWNRGSVTIYYLGGKLSEELPAFKDRQCARNNSWWIDENSAWALRSQDLQFLWMRLLKPPKRFILAFRDEIKKPDKKGKLIEQPLLLQLLTANDPGGVLGDTPLFFTHGCTTYQYTVYELEEAIKYGPEPYGPGVNALFRILGDVPNDIKQKYPRPSDKKDNGRPPALPDSRSQTKKVVTASGSNDEDDFIILKRKEK